jgi:ABC-type sugar transport system permease subunit
MATRNVYSAPFVATARPVWCWLGVLPALVIVLVLVVYPLAVAMLTSLPLAAGRGGAARGRPRHLE